MGRLRIRPRTPPTGQEPGIYQPKTPMNEEAPIPEGENPVLAEPPTNGIPVDSEIPEEPGRPRPSIPWKPGAPVTERQRTPIVDHSTGEE